MRTTVLALLAFVLLPGPTSALTIDEVVALSRAGVNEEVILALIERDKTIFTVEPQQLIALKDQGVSERLVLAMLKSGRQEPQALVGNSVATDAVQSLPSEPHVAFVGHGPDRPNSYHARDRTVIVYTLPYIPYGSIVEPCVSAHNTTPSRVRTDGQAGSKSAVTGTESLRGASQKFVNSAWPQHVLESAAEAAGNCAPMQTPRGRRRR